MYKTLIFKRMKYSHFNLELFLGKLFLMACMGMILNQRIHAQKQDSTFIYLIPEINRIEIGVGSHFPVGKMKEMLEASLQLQFWYRLELQPNSFDIGIQLHFPKSIQSLIIENNNQIYETNSQRFAGMIGFRKNYHYYFDSKGYFYFNYDTMLGYGFLTYFDVLKYHSEMNQSSSSDRKNGYTKAISTIYLGSGFTFGYKYIGVKSQIQYTPHQLFGQTFTQSIGDWSYHIGIVYKQ